MGRPSAAGSGFASVIDLRAELPAPHHAPGAVIPMLDLVPPSAFQLRRAAAAIDHARQRGPVLVCCALGYSRSAAAAAAWLLLTRRAPDADAAIAMVRSVRPRLVLDDAARAAIAAAGPLP